MIDKKKLVIVPTVNPVAHLPITGDVEKDFLAEQGMMTAAFDEQKAGAEKKGYFKGKEKKENDRRKLSVDTNYWCCFVFQSEAQKMAFLANAGIEELGVRYLDGRLAAKKLGVSIPEQTVGFQGEKEDAAMTVNFEPIEPLPTTYTGKADRK